MQPLTISLLSGADDATMNERMREIQLQQTSVFTTFCAKRNSGRIRRYFIRSKSVLCQFMIITLMILTITLGPTLNFWWSSHVVRENWNMINAETMGFRQERMSNTLVIHFTTLYVYSSAFAAVFPDEKPMLDMNKINAERITSFLSAFAQISKVNVSWWDLGRSDGMYIGMVSRLTDWMKGNPEKLLYCEAKEKELHGWLVDASGKNASYPWEGGDLIMQYDVTARTWFANAVTKKGVTCNDLIPESTAGDIGKNAPWFACSCPGTGLSMVAALGTPISGIQDWLQYNANTTGSKLALIREDDNMVMGIVGTDPPFDEYDNSLFLKSQDQLADPIWRAVLDSKSEWITEAEASSYVKRTFHINGKDMNLNIRIGKISLFGEGEMTFYMVFGDDRELPTGQWLKLYAIVLFGLSTLLISVLLAVIYFAVSKFRLARKTKIEGLAKKYNIEEFGVRQVPILLDHVKRSHADNPHIVSVVMEAEQMLSHYGNDLYFNTTSFYASISDENLRRKFGTIFGSYNPETNRRKNSEWITAIDSQAQLGLLSWDSWSESFNIPVPEVGDDSIIFSIVKMLHKYNDHRILFNNAQFNDFIGRAITKVDPEYHPLLYHSIVFNDFFLSQRISSILPDSDHALALMLITMMWHVEMSALRNQAIFLPDDSSFANSVKAFLLDLYDALANLDSPMLERWNLFVSRTNALRSHSSISQIGYFFAYTSLFAKDATGPLETETESIMVVGSLFVSSMFSHMFCDSDSSQYAPFNPDLDAPDTQEGEFARRLREVLFQQSKDLLADICAIHVEAPAYNH